MASQNPREVVLQRVERGRSDRSHKGFLKVDRRRVRQAASLVAGQGQQGHATWLSVLLATAFACPPMQDLPADAVIRFGYGSNMGPSVLRNKKNLHLLWHGAGAVKDFRLAYFDALAHVEPGFAMAMYAPGHEIEGLAFALGVDDARALDAQERGYDLTEVEVALFGGGSIRAGLYTKKDAKEGALPSLRYNRLMLAGALEAGLTPAYIERLRTEYYVTPPALRARTRQLVDEAPKDNWFTAEELSKHTTEAAGVWTSVMGLVVAVNAWNPAWRGHEVTRRSVIHFRGESVDRLDVRWGAPGFRPLPRLEDLADDEREYLWQVLDSLLVPEKSGRILGRLQDFFQDQSASQQSE
jgi:hypothetical protein